MEAVYNIIRSDIFLICLAIINLLLIISFMLTAISGMTMSIHATPFLYRMIDVGIAREIHLALSYWSFILMGFHIGLHANIIISSIKNKIDSNNIRYINTVLNLILIIITIYGLYLFIHSPIIDYITFKIQFAFFDYEKSKLLVIYENLCMLVSFASIIHYIILLIQKINTYNNK